jgi:hypothetical protein
MALPLNNNAEGGTDDVTVTTGNSGGASGDAFDGVTIAAGGSITFDNAQAKGVLAVKLVQGSSAGNNYVSWAAAFGTQTTYYGRLYLYRTANPSANVALMRGVTSSTPNAWVMLVTSGVIRCRGNATTPATDGSVAIALNAWNRVEFKVVCHASAGVVTAKLFAGANFEGTTPDETIEQTGVNTGANNDGVWFGMQGVDPSGVAWYDDLNLNATDYPGPTAPGAAQPLITVFRPRLMRPHQFKPCLAR